MRLTFATPSPSRDDALALTQFRVGRKSAVVRQADDVDVGLLPDRLFQTEESDVVHQSVVVELYSRTEKKESE